MAGRFVVFEGIDGCGKQTQIAMLSKKLVEMDIKFALFKYPTGNAVKIKSYLEGKEKIPTEKLLSLYADDILQEQGGIEEAAASGWAIADRYAFSTAAYQGAGGRLDWAVGEMDKRTWISPDMLIWLDLDVDEAMRRKAGQKKPDIHEKDRKFLEEVRGNYSELCRRRWLTGNWKKIDASKPKEDVFGDVCRALGL
jgi:dTMP kinase